MFDSHWSVRILALYLDSKSLSGPFNSKQYSVNLALEEPDFCDGQFYDRTMRGIASSSPDLGVASIDMGTDRYEFSVEIKSIGSTVTMGSYGI